MFEHEGATRSHRHNQILAGYLAFVAGFVNSAGFILIGSFTSHVTGNIGRFADDLAMGRSAAVFAAVMAIMFFAGAFTASMWIESNLVQRRAHVYGLLLLLEAALLAAFATLSYVIDTRNPRFHDVQAMLLCFAMGLQNSLVTRLSGAIVRTTHLTGVVTDLAIESARWFRHWRGRLGARTQLRLVVGGVSSDEPQAPRTYLLITIVASFVGGSALGALLVARLGQAALLVPTVLLVVMASSALTTKRVLLLTRPV